MARLTTRLLRHFAFLLERGCCFVQVPLLEVVKDVHVKPTQQTVFKALLVLKPQRVTWQTHMCVAFQAGSPEEGWPVRLAPFIDAQAVIPLVPQKS